MKTGEQYRVEITAFDHEGRGICRIEGYTVFVENGVLGDQLVIELTKCNKTFGLGKIVTIIMPSPHRRNPECPYEKNCGACQLMHIDYSQQLAMKRQIVSDALCRIGGFSQVTVHDAIGAEQVFHYRNKSQFPVSSQKGKVEIGFFSKKSHYVVDLHDCLISNEAVSSLLSFIRAFMEEKKIKAYDEAAHTGLLRHIIVRNTTKGKQIMLILVINGTALPYSDELVAALKERFSNLQSVYLNFNTKKTNLILGSQSQLIYGTETITDSILGKNFSISPESFYQINWDQTQILYQKALELADIQKNEIVFDVYCGIGTISLCAADFAKEVIGIEYVKEAVLDAQKNAELNGITNVQFLAGEAEKILPNLVRSGKKADKIILDPPRKGAQPEVLEAILKANPKRIVYVSCNPSTLARDLKILCGFNYRLCEVQPVDMFPHTNHVETVVLLSKGEIDSKKVRVEFSLEDMDMSGFQKDATYGQIKERVLQQTGLKVSSLYISQVKQKYGIIERENYNKPKSENARQPKCPPEKEAAITEALKFFGMI